MSVKYYITGVICYVWVFVLCNVGLLPNNNNQYIKSPDPKPFTSLVN